MSETSAYATTRLVVAADFKPEVPGGRGAVHRKILDLARDLRGMDVIIKVNSALRALGYDLIDQISTCLLGGVGADLKESDISETLETDGLFLREAEPAFVTVMASAGVDAMKKLRGALHPSTELLAVTVLTSFDELGCQQVFGRSIREAVINLATLAREAGCNGLVLSGRELAILKEARLDEGMTLNIPAIRPSWSVVPGDDQKRVVTPADAIRMGATRIIVGRPILNAAPNDKGLPQNPREAVEWTLREIEEVLPTQA